MSDTISLTFVSVPPLCVIFDVILQPETNTMIYVRMKISSITFGHSFSSKNDQFKPRRRVPRFFKWLKLPGPHPSSFGREFKLSER